MAATNKVDAELASLRWQKWEGVLRAFEDAWQQGDPPDLESFCRKYAATEPGVIAELVHLDLEYRLKAEDDTRVEHYLKLFPQLAQQVNLVARLLASEFELRRRRQADLHLEEYRQRFPQCHPELISILNTGKGSGTDTGKPAPEQPRETAGTFLGDYEIIGELGRGGMGVVYRALDRKRSTLVALKTLPWLEPSALYRFKQEFRALADLAHANLVTLYELVADQGKWFFTMEYIEGEDFLSHVRGAGPDSERASSQTPAGRCSPARLRAALVELAQGMTVLHQAGKLHRDIKPSNVLVTPQSRVVLLDFGLAANLDESGRHQNSEAGIVGTVAYMAPEQAAAQPVSAASDWYSVGVMIYEALTGQLPHRGTVQQILQAKRDSFPPEPRALCPDVPEDLNSLCVALLAQDPLRRPAGSQILRQLAQMAPAKPSADPAQTQAHETAAFVGRAQHLRELWEAFRIMQGGQPVLVTVEGRSGAGKSALLQHFLDQVAAQEKVVILSGRCFEQESVPYKALDSLVDALSRYLRRLPLSEAQQVMPRDALQLARVFPVLQAVEAVARAPVHAAEAPDPHELRRRAFAALRELLGRLSDRQPIVLCLDDLQWGDLDSATLLADLLLPPNPPVLLLVFSFRSEDRAASPFLRSFFQAQGRSIPHQRALIVEGLTTEETHELAMLLLGAANVSRARADEIVRESGGNPLFVGELVHCLRGQDGTSAGLGSAATPSLDEVLWRRIVSLPEQARLLLEVAAVAGQPLGQRDACRAAELTDDERPVLALLRSCRFLRSTGASESEKIEIYHDRVRETILGHLPVERLRAHHRRIAVTLSARADADPEFLAVHYQGAGEQDEAGQYYARAAHQAARALAFDHAAQLYLQALELRSWPAPDECRLQIERGDALANAGRGSEAAREYQAAAKKGEPTQQLDLGRRAALQLMTSGHVDEGIAQLRPVLSAAGTGLARKPWQALASLLIRRAQVRLRGLGFHERSEADVSPEELKHIDLCWSVVVGLSIVDPIRGAEFQTRNLLLALRAGEPFRVARALAGEAGFLASSGAAGRRRANRILDEADQLTRRVAQPYARAIVEMARGTVAYFAEDWNLSHALCSRAEAIFRDHCTGVTWEIDTSSAFSLWSLTRMGKVAELARLCPGLLAEALQRGDRYAATNLSTQIMTLVRLAADEPADARQELERVMGAWSQKGYHIQHHDALLAFVPLELYCGRAELAWERVLAEWSAFRWSLLSQVQDLRIEMLQLRAYCALAMAAHSGDPSRYLRAAVKDAGRLRREQMPWTEALALYIEGTVAHLRGHVAQAIEKLEAAVASFDRLDAGLHAATTRRRLGRLQGTPENNGRMQESDEWMLSQNIKNPARLTAAYAPGYPD